MREIVRGHGLIGGLDRLYPCELIRAGLRICSGSPELALFFRAFRSESALLQQILGQLTAGRFVGGANHPPLLSPPKLILGSHNQRMACALFLQYIQQFDLALACLCNELMLDRIAQVAE